MAFQYTYTYTYCYISSRPMLSHALCFYEPDTGISSPQTTPVPYLLAVYPYHIISYTSRLTQQKHPGYVVHFPQSPENPRSRCSHAVRLAAAVPFQMGSCSHC